MKVKILSSFPKQTLNVDKVYFSSDFHIDHKAVIDFGRKFDSVEHMNDHIIVETNKLVRENDLLVLMGDTMMNEKDYVKFLNSLVCDNVIMLFGNHCNRGKLYSALLECDKLLYIGDYLELNIEKQIICCSHFPHFCWNYQDEGSFFLHGHCVDTKTEILTTKGWKNYESIKINDSIYSITNNGIIENKVINKIIKEDYKEDVFLYESRFASLCVTDKHRMVERTENGIQYSLAKDYFNSYNKNLILSGSINNKGIILSDDLLRLYIFLAADGNYNIKTNLARISLQKTRKIEFIEKLLIDIGIDFTKNITKVGGYTFNFKLPNELKDYNIKGLDYKLIECSERQVDIIVDMYSKTDGNCNSKTVVIYTSKKEEVELLQHLLSINNYSTTVSSRIGHGFSVKEAFQISVSKSRNLLKFSSFKNRLKKEKLTSNTMWCVETELGNFMCRRGGKTYFTGNCHGDEPHLVKEIHKYKSMDVGIDAFYNMFGEYSLFSYELIQQLLKNKLTIGRHE